MKSVQHLTSLGLSLVITSVGVMSSASKASAGEITVKVAPQTIIPPWTSGPDPEFGANGPRIRSSAQIFVRNGQLWATICMSARENKSNWTVASGCSDRILYDGRRDSVRVLGLPLSQDKLSLYEGVDYDHDLLVTEDDNNNELVRSFEIFGDGKGSDAGLTTRTTFNFSAIRVLVR